MGADAGKTVGRWASETLVKLGIIAGIASAAWTIFMPTSPAKLVADISVVVDNAVTITEQAKEFPLTAADVDLFREWACTQVPEHEIC